MKIQLTKISLVSLVSLIFLIILLSSTKGPVWATEISGISAEPKEFLMAGRTEGAGTYFEIKDSEYLNINLKSSEGIKTVLESIPRMISLDIETASPITSTNLTLEGLEPNKIYYKYEDSYKNEAVFLSDEKGSYNWTQDGLTPKFG